MEKVLSVLKENSIRVTPQRMELIAILKNNKQHLAAEEVYDQLSERYSTVSITTVYNNLKLLVKLGFVKELNFGEGLSKFEWMEKDHYHIICTECGKLEDFYYPALKEVEAFAHDLSKFKIHKHQLQFYGICSMCANGEKNNKGDDC